MPLRSEMAMALEPDANFPIINLLLDSTLLELYKSSMLIHLLQELAQTHLHNIILKLVFYREQPSDLNKKPEPEVIAGKNL